MTYYWHLQAADDRLRSALRRDYLVPRTARMHMPGADSSFSVAGPTMWNQSNFVGHPLTARFEVAIKHFYSQVLLLAYLMVRRPWTSDGGCIAND